jgi:elongator complex protein 3
MGADASGNGEAAGAAGEDGTFRRVCAELVDRILAGEVDRERLETAKREVCGEYSAGRVPRNSDLLAHAPDGRREEVKEVVRRKPVRTASGVSPVAIMTSPRACPHGRCLYCPGGPASEFSSAQSYTGHEPAAARGEQNDYDPYGQVRLRLEQLRSIGHPVEKVELILMGGTMTARSHDYQEWFVKRALAAMNDYDLDSDPTPAVDESFAPEGTPAFRYLEDVLTDNETADVRNVATTFETKPDWCGPEQIDRMLRLGGTKVEVGVQTTYERINREMGRGHGTAASKAANRRLRDAGFKVGFHMMPGQPGMTRAMCVEDFRRLFAGPAWRPDYLKIYPTLVVEGTRVYDMWQRGDFDPLDSDEAADLVAEITGLIPRYTRLQRVQRDIPADLIDAGVTKSNLRQLAAERARERGTAPEDIRAREVGLNDADPDPDAVEITATAYEAAGGTERFIAAEDPVHDLLIGFCRLRFPSFAPDQPGPPGGDGDGNGTGGGTDPGDPPRRELAGAALVRELHVYGSAAGIGEDGDWQHRGWGGRLLARAEEIARDAGYRKLCVLSGIGVREYYRDRGYHDDGPYMTTRL